MELLLKVLGSGKARDAQTRVGPSELGGCRRRVYERLHGTPSCNTTLRMAAWMGTAIHEELRKAVKREDPFGDRYLTEVEVSVDDPGGISLTGHVDVFDKQTGEVIDWKTTTKAKLADFPSRQQMWQVHVYGWLLSRNGYAVNTVTLVGIPRDADERYVKTYSVPYDPEIAFEALGWLAQVQGLESAPEPEMHPNFCKHYCQFWGPEHGCPGKS